jgi:hypothetical protein
VAGRPPRAAGHLAQPAERHLGGVEALPAAVAGVPRAPRWRAGSTAARLPPAPLQSQHRDRDDTAARSIAAAGPAAPTRDVDSAMARSRGQGAARSGSDNRPDTGHEQLAGTGLTCRNGHRGAGHQQLRDGCHGGRLHPAACVPANELALNAAFRNRGGGAVHGARNNAARRRVCPGCGGYRRAFAEAPAGNGRRVGAAGWTVNLLKARRSRPPRKGRTAPHRSRSNPQSCRIPPPDQHARDVRGPAAGAM